MLGICENMRDRLTNVLKASQSITQDVTTNVVHVNDVKWFDLLDYYTTKRMKCLIFDGNNTKTKVEILSVDSNANTFTLTENVSSTISASDNPVIYRAPAYNKIKKFWIGDLSVVHDYPTICIQPGQLGIEWLTLAGTTNEFDLDLMVYLLDRTSTENVTLDLLETTREVKETLMADLHLKIRNEHEDQWGRVYDSRVKNIDYGVLWLRKHEKDNKSNI